MNKFVMMMVTLMVTLFGLNAFAFTPPDAPAKGWYVVDKAGKLSQSEIARLNQKIEQVSRATKNEFGVLVLDTMDGGNIEDAAYDTFKKWGVGKHGLDNGVLVVISVKERKSRIETGKGVGGEVPDIKAKEILDRNLAPHLKRGDFYGGLDETLSALSSLIESRHNEKATPRPTPVTVPTSSPATTSNPVGVTPPTSGPRTNNGGCAIAAVGSTNDSGFPVMLLGAGIIFLGGWLVARRAKKKQEEALAREAQAQEARRLAKLKLQEEFDKAQRERARLLELQKPPTKAPSIPPTPVVKRESYVPTPRTVTPVSPLPIPRPIPRVKPVEPRPVVSAPTTVVAAGETIAAAAAAVALRRQQEESAAEERRIREAGEENRRRQARREAEAEEERRAEERREARRREEREDEERRAQARREEEERYEARRREQEEDDRRRREEESRSSYSSYDSGSSSSDSDSGGGFGGGDSGGGGASSDW